jgi:hypothetical protein
MKSMIRRRGGRKSGMEGTWIGVAGCEEVMEWIWDRHFSAIAGDAIGFEAWPPKAPYRKFKILVVDCWDERK